MRNLSLVLLFIITLLFFVTKTTPQKNIELIGSPSQNNEENNKIQKITSMSCSDVAISIRGRLPITVHGSIFLEGKKFRMITFSLLGKEFDIGININSFDINWPLLNPIMSIRDHSLPHLSTIDLF